MYEYIKGIYDSSRPGYLVLENNGIAYLLHYVGPISWQKGEELKLYLYQHVKPESLDLYAFTSREERELFLDVLSVSGVGPKTALQIVQSLSPVEFASAVLHKDIQKLTQVKGLGKKGAERILVDLHDKMKKMQLQAGAEPTFVPSLSDETNALDPKAHELYEALLVLGFSSSEAAHCQKNCYQADQSIEENIRSALQELNRY